MKFAMGTLSLLLLAACDKSNSGSNSSSSNTSASSWKASTPKEFFESVKSCSEKKDIDTMWNNAFTKASKEEMIKQMTDLIKQMKDAPAMKERMMKDAKLEKDPTTMTPEELIKAFQKSELENDPEEYTLVSVDEKGDKATVKVKEKKVKKNTEKDKEWNLVKENGSWKMEMK